VTGQGCIPFVLGASREHPAWLRLNLPDGVELIDTPLGAVLRREGQADGVRYPVGTFWRGLARPWMGLHAIDTIRRDGAQERIPFTAEDLGYGLAEIALIPEEDNGEIQLKYEVALNQDLIRRIYLDGRDAEGTLEFAYLEDVGSADDRFAEPVLMGSEEVSDEAYASLWLVDLARGVFGAVN